MVKDEEISHRRPMKARSFLSAVAAALFTLLFAAAGLFWAMDQGSPLRLSEQPLHLPRAAQFVPRDAALSLHWLMDSSRLPAYVQSVAPASERRAARDAAGQWREAALALAGLNYASELAPWLGTDLSLALLDAADQPGWVLALTSRDSDGARRFLQRFWQTRSLAGTDLQISSYRGIGLISGRGALIGHEPQPLATALIDDDLLLLASGRGVLERALDVSQLKDQHQLGDQALQRRVAGLGTGVALMTASPRGLQQWLSLPAAIAERDQLSGLVAAVRPEGAELVADAALLFQGQLDVPSWSPLDDLVTTTGGRARWLAQLQAPARLLDPEDTHPLAQWLGPWLRNQLRDHPAAAAVLQRDDGPLLWQQQDEGWLLTSRHGHPALSEVDAQLQDEGLSRSALAEEGDNLQVWTRLVHRRGRTNGLDAQLAVVQASSSGQDWWAETLAAMALRRDNRGVQTLRRQWQALKGTDSPAQAMLLDSTTARELLRQWTPWGQLMALTGQPLQERVTGLGLTLGVDHQDDDSTELPLNVRLAFG